MKMKGADLEELRTKAQRFNRNWQRKGGLLTHYTCPKCRSKIAVRRPSRGDVGQKGHWDSLTICTHCGVANFVVVYPTGRTEVR